MPDALPAPPVVDRPLFFLDYDGTLAPFQDDPMQAVPHPEVPPLIDRLAARHPLWIVTGRHLRDLEVLLDRAVPAIGLHGTQEARLGDPIESLMSEEALAAVAAWRTSAPELPDVWMEDKQNVFALHYRKARDKEAVRAHLRTWLTGLPPFLDAIWGKDVVEIRQRGLDKGVAVRRIAGRYPDRQPIYLGDDVTDEDAFVALGETAVTVKVGHGATQARYRLGGVEAVVDYLKQYVPASD